ncbi:MAG: hypothetical protein ACLP50_09045 [Solirubrobacteraceae bacterium]
MAIVGLALAGLGALPMTVTASGPPPPINDNYLDSLELNGPGTKLNDMDTLEDVRNTTNATVQTNIFNPCGQASCPSGPPEVTSCRGVSYGNTIWYDFYPNLNGSVEIRTSGFDNVITLYRFNLKTALPDTSHATCAHNSDFPSEEMVAPVEKGRSYTIQIGGVNNVGGPLELLFDFFATPPHRLTAQATLTAKQIPNGLELLALSVSTARAAKVEVKCGRFCRPESASDHAVEGFPGLHGVQMPSGSKLQIFVTAPHSIGFYIQYGILPGNFAKLTGCLEPGSDTPHMTCH